ncbi:MAG: PPOX class F420-dependent oxidoreductase [Actinomycetes bacterium]
MTDTEVAAFLASEPPHTAKVASTRKDGRPHVAPVWFAVDGGTIVFTTGANTVKGRTIRRDPRIALCVDDERPPFSFVVVEGTAVIVDDIDEVRHWATVIGGRYMGADRAESYGARNGVPGELLIRLHPERVTSAKDMAD